MTYSTRLALIALGLICNILITRSLGVENYGSYVLFLTLTTTLVQVSNFGIPASNLYLAAKNNKDSSLLIVNSLVYSLIATFICGMFYASNFFGIALDNISPLFFTATIFLVLFVSLERNVLIGIGEIAKDNISNITSRLLITIFLLVCFLTGNLSFSMAANSYIIFFILVFLCVGYSLYKMNLSLVRPSFKFFFNNVSFNVKSYFTTLFSFLVLKVDIFIISYFLTKSDTGLYSFSASFIDYVYLLPVVISTIIFQKYSSMSSFLDRVRLHNKVCVLFFPFYLFFIVTVYFSLDYVVPYLFGEQYTPAIDYIEILVIAIFVMGCSTILQQFLVSSGFPKTLVFLWGCALLVNVVINFIYIPVYGLYAAAYSTLISYSLIFIFSLMLIEFYKLSK